MKEEMSIESRLQEHFELTARSDFFAGLYDNIIHWREAPFISKAELIPLLEERFKLEEQTHGVYLVRSGGSTRAPLVFPVDIQENHYQRQQLAEALLESGIFSPRTVALNVYGYADLYRTAAIMDDIMEKCGSTTLPLSSHAQKESVETAIRKFKPDFIFGTPSQLKNLAYHFEEQGKQFDVPNALYGGEVLRESLKPIIERVFGIRNYYSIFGGAETGLWAWTHFPEGKAIFRLLPGVHIEIVEPDDEGFGSIAVTNLYRRRFPLFRYLIGDIGRLVECEGQQCLEIKGRSSASFTFWELHHDLSNFEALYADVQQWQFQLSRSGNLREKLRLLLVDDTLPEHEREGRSAQRLAKLKELVFFHPKYMEVELEYVAPDQLFQDSTTSKTPAVKDYR